MTQHPTYDDVLSLIADTREQLTYFQELGVELLQVSSVSSDELTPQASSVTRTIPIETAAAPKLPAPSSSQVIANTVRVRSSASALFEDLAPTPEIIEKSDETFEQIRADIGDCTRCRLYQGRTNVVHTEGNPKARLMFVGEAPGADEDIQARPFVGRAGQLLTRIIEAIGLKREEVLIGNINRCRPPGNRAPTSDEADVCKPFLLREIAAVQPEVIVVLGNTAMKNLLDTKEGITKLRGHFQNYRGSKVMPTFHPAYLLRDPSKKRETWEDLKKVREYLDSKSQA